MPTWLWVVIIGLGIFLALAFVGYLMGPQSGKALTKRDQRLLDRNAPGADAYLNSASHRADVAMMAEGTMDLARDHNASGIPATESLVLAFEKMDHFERAQGNRGGLGPWLMQITGFLMEVGVVNPMDPAQIEARLPGFSRMLKRDPGVLARVAGVRDLYAWPASTPRPTSNLDASRESLEAAVGIVKPSPRRVGYYDGAEDVDLPAFPQRDDEWFANVITVVGSRRSAGKTLVACNLAATIASMGKSVALFDCDLQFGEVGEVFGCDPSAYSTLDLSTAETANADLRRVLPTPRDGLWVVPGVSEPSLADSISDEGLVRGVVTAASEFDVVIIDSALFLDEPIVTLIQKSGLTLFVDNSTDGSWVMNTNLMLDTLALVKCRDQCLMVRNGPENPFFGNPGPAWYVNGRMPAWPILPQDESIDREDMTSLLIVERAPESPLAEQLTALAEAIVERLVP